MLNLMLHCWTSKGFHIIEKEQTKNALNAIMFMSMQMQIDLYSSLWSEGICICILFALLNDKPDQELTMVYNAYSSLCLGQFKSKNTSKYPVKLWPHYYPAHPGLITFNLSKTHFIFPAQHFVLAEHFLIPDQHYVPADQLLIPAHHFIFVCIYVVFC